MATRNEYPEKNAWWINELNSLGIKKDGATNIHWLSMLGIGTLCFGLSLFVLRIPIRTTIVFFIIGVPLVALWLYVDAD